MFSRRFPNVDVSTESIDNLRLLEGQRVKALYQELGVRFGVTWKGRNYDPKHWMLADEINRAISVANASLYALCAAMVCALVYLPQLGFIHVAGSIPFVFDIADLYKPQTSFEAAFAAVSANPKADGNEVLAVLKSKIEEARLLQRLPRDLEELLA